MGQSHGAAIGDHGHSHWEFEGCTSWMAVAAHQRPHLSHFITTKQSTFVNTSFVYLLRIITINSILIIVARPCYTPSALSPRTQAYVSPITVNSMRITSDTKSMLQYLILLSVRPFQAVDTLIYPSNRWFCYERAQLLTCNIL